MKYKTIKADLKTGKCGTEIFISIRENAGDRKKTRTVPHSAGFYHYPEQISDELACQQLQTTLLLQGLKDIQHTIRVLNAVLSPVLPADLSDYDYKWSPDNRVVQTLRTTERRLAIFAKKLRNQK